MTIKPHGSVVRLQVGHRHQTYTLNGHEVTVRNPDGECQTHDLDVSDIRGFVLDGLFYGDFMDLPDGTQRFILEVPGCSAPIFFIMKRTEEGLIVSPM